MVYFNIQTASNVQIFYCLFFQSLWKEVPSTVGWHHKFYSLLDAHWFLCSSAVLHHLQLRVGLLCCCALLPILHPTWWLHRTQGLHQRQLDILHHRVHHVDSPQSSGNVETWDMWLTWGICKPKLLHVGLLCPDYWRLMIYQYCT